MKLYDVTAVSGRGIDFAPATETEEILQNLRTILATAMGSVPLDRAFGVDASYVDRPMAKARAMLASEILVKIRAYEPRVTVTAVDFEEDMDGILRPKVQVKINGME